MPLCIVRIVKRLDCIITLSSSRTFAVSCPCGAEAGGVPQRVISFSAFPWQAAELGRPVLMNLLQGPENTAGAAKQEAAPSNNSPPKDQARQGEDQGYPLR